MSTIKRIVFVAMFSGITLQAMEQRSLGELNFARQKELRWHIEQGTVFRIPNASEIVELLKPGQMKDLEYAMMFVGMQDLKKNIAYVPARYTGDVSGKMFVGVSQEVFNSLPSILDFLKKYRQSLK